jgi:hypothetical protein
MLNALLQNIDMIKTAQATLHVLALQIAHLQGDNTPFDQASDIGLLLKLKADSMRLRAAFGNTATPRLRAALLCCSCLQLTYSM